MTAIPHGLHIDLAFTVLPIYFVKGGMLYHRCTHSAVALILLLRLPCTTRCGVTLCFCYLSCLGSLRRGGVSRSRVSLKPRPFSFSLCRRMPLGIGHPGIFLGGRRVGAGV